MLARKTVIASVVCLLIVGLAVVTFHEFVFPEIHATNLCKAPDINRRADTQVPGYSKGPNGRK